LSEDVRFFVSAENGEPSFVRKAYDQDGDGIQAPLPLNAFRDELGDLLPVIREFSSEPSVAFKQDVFEPRVNIKPPTQRSVSSDQSLDVSKGRG
jgi:hypothetical protein